MSDGYPTGQTKLRTASGEVVVRIEVNAERRAGTLEFGKFPEDPRLILAEVPEEQLINLARLLLDAVLFGIREREVSS